MRRLVVMLVVLFVGSVAYAQVGVPSPGPLPPVPAFGSTTSVIDHNGNVLVFDLLFSAPMAGQTPVVKTRVTVVTADGTAKPPVEYAGAFQLIGAGWYAVYATTNAYAYTAAPTTIVPTRRLVAFNAIAGVLPSILPSVDAPLRADIKLSASRDNTGSDIISFVDPLSDPRILTPTTSTTTAPITRRFAQIVKYAGLGNFVVGAQIPLP
jgi:hypothetical protein